MSSERLIEPVQGADEGAIVGRLQARIESLLGIEAELRERLGQLADREKLLEDLDAASRDVAALRAENEQLRGTVERQQRARFAADAMLRKAQVRLADLERILSDSGLAGTTDRLHRALDQQADDYRALAEAYKLLHSMNARLELQLALLSEETRAENDVLRRLLRPVPLARALRAMKGLAGKFVRRPRVPRTP
jgi:chromosome segregation ATPase